MRGASKPSNMSEQHRVRMPAAPCRAQASSTGCLLCQGQGAVRLPRHCPPQHRALDFVIALAESSQISAVELLRHLLRSKSTPCLVRNPLRMLTAMNPEDRGPPAQLQWHFPWPGRKVEISCKARSLCVVRIIRNMSKGSFQLFTCATRNRNRKTGLLVGPP